MTYEWITVCGIGFIFLMNTLGALCVFAFLKGISEKVQTLFFGFSGGVMIAASVWSLLLPAIEQTSAQGRFSIWIVACGFLLGGFCLYGIDRFLAAFRRRKSRITASDASETGRAGARNGVKWGAAMKLFLAVTLHNIPEGLAVGFAFGIAHEAGGLAEYIAALGLAIGIGIQNLPEGAAVALPMRKEGQSANRAFLYGALSGIVEPIFAVGGYYLVFALQAFQPWLLALSAGAMIYVTVEELLPDIGRSGHVTCGAWSFMSGFLVMMLLDVLLG